MGTDKKRNLSVFALDAFRWVVIAASVVFALWVFHSCVADIDEKQEKRAAEAYNEAYQEGYRDGQWKLIEYLQEEARYEIGDPYDMANDLLNGGSRDEFVEEWEDFFKWLDNLEPRD